MDVHTCAIIPQPIEKKTWNSTYMKLDKGKTTLYA